MPERRVPGPVLAQPRRFLLRRATMSGSGAVEMLRTPTVLILGAGASSPYNFPLGSGLKSEILNHAQQNLAMPPNLHLAGGMVGEFAETLRGTALPTIDIFLEKKAGFRELGAFLIARVIMAAERISAARLFPQSDWYADLFTALDFENAAPDASMLSVVTLNYDRSLEHFLTKNIDFNCQDRLVQAAHEKRGKIRIVHAHGSLGAYPEVSYGAYKEDDLVGLEKAARGIRIISDKMDDSPDFHKAQQLISEAERIIFLGFGYEERTLKALFQDKPPKGKQLHGTAYQLADSRREMAHRFLDNQMAFGDRDQQSRQFLRLIGLTSTPKD